MESLESRTLLSAQMISSSVEAIEVEPSETIVVPVLYSTIDDTGQAAAVPSVVIGFNIHFDSQALTFMGTRNVLTDDLISVPTEVPEGAYGATIDGNPDTDLAINTAYLNIFGLFPNEPTTEPLILFEAVFKVTPDFQGTSEINFTRNGDSPTLNGHAFEFESQSVQVMTQPAKEAAAGEPVKRAVLPSEFSSKAEHGLEFSASRTLLRPAADVTSAQTVNATGYLEVRAGLPDMNVTETVESWKVGQSTLPEPQRVTDEPIMENETLDSLFATEFTNGFETVASSIRI